MHRLTPGPAPRAPPPPRSYVGDGYGLTSQEKYLFYKAGALADTTAIQPGNSIIISNVFTGQYCQLADLPAGYALGKSSRSLLQSSAASRALKQTSCLTKGIICNQPSAAAATPFTYTGTGLSFSGTSVVQSPNSYTLLISNAPECTIPDGAVYTFPSANGGAQRPLRRRPLRAAPRSRAHASMHVRPRASTRPLPARSHPSLRRPAAQHHGHHQHPQLGGQGHEGAQRAGRRIQDVARAERD
jgi:hypothetical protein